MVTKKQLNEAKQQSARSQRAGERRARERRKRLMLLVVPIIVVIAIIAVFVVVKVESSPKKSVASSVAPAALVSQVSTIPASDYDRVGVGKVQAAPKAITGTALTANGKPLIVYIGAEYCPYCAAERWAMVTALSRFGTWSNLGLTSSSATDVDANTPTFSFHGATYSSPYLEFQGVETTTNQQKGNSYAPLDKPTDAQQALETQYDSNGSIPFIDFGNQWLINGATYDPGVLAGRSQQQVADSLSDPLADSTASILGASNAVTAAICKMTNGQPGNVCTTPGVTAAAATLQSS